MKNLKVKHTPGPWKITHETVATFVVRDSQGRALLANTTIGQRTDESIEINQANAALIAAAPEMLEALEQAESVFNVNEIDALQAFAMIERIRHLIAKAKGQ